MQHDFIGVLISLFLLLIGTAGPGSAQVNLLPNVRFKVLYNFTGGEDGCCLYGGLARDNAGNLYGVAYIDDNGSGAGELFKLTLTNTGYKLEVLHDFTFTDGLCITTPTFDSGGNLYGVCTDIPEAAGTLWEYSHDGRFLVLHTFDLAKDGSEPQDTVVVDSAGNIYGTAYIDGPAGAGTFWRYSQSSGSFTVLHAFGNGDDGGNLPAGPAMDNTGKIWGTTEFGPNCYFCLTGTVWSYDPAAGTFTTVLDFGASGVNAPQSHFVVDATGNLYGTAFGTTQGNCGLVYELQKSNNYAPVILYEFSGRRGDGCYPFGNVVLDDAGNLLGTTYNGGIYGYGAVYELSPMNGVWSEATLHSFNLADGFRPQTGLTKVGAGKWAGTASAGGKAGEGTVFQISGVN